MTTSEFHAHPEDSSQPLRASVDAESSSDDISIVAIIAAFNEADVIGEVIGDLVAQSVHVYVIDDGSTDATADIVSAYLGHGVLGMDRRTAEIGRPYEHFHWGEILRRKSELSTTLAGDWFIHHDADEFRESPWAGLSLRQAIARVDRWGFNAIDFECLQFVPPSEPVRTGGVRDRMTSFRTPAAHDRLQIRCWKRTSTPVDLESSGGHEAIFPGRRVFPLRFLLRHYPIRDAQHMRRKVFDERRPRFLLEERERGWHVQYDGITADDITADGMGSDAPPPRPYDPDEVRLGLMLRHRNVEALEHECATLKADRDAKSHELDAKDRDLADLKASHDILNQRAAFLDAAMRQSASDAMDLQSRLHAVRQLQVLAEQEKETLRLEIDKTRAAAESARREVRALYDSMSWRLAAPFRAIYRAVMWVAGRKA